MMNTEKGSILREPALAVAGEQKENIRNIED